MQFAYVDGLKQTASPGLPGICPCCDLPVIPKCGTQVAWHWAHTAGSDCDSWSEPTGPWHLSWQNMVRVECVEVVRAPHRADIVGNEGRVVELQHSSIGAEMIQAREDFYGDMVWLFDATARFRKVESGDRVFFSLGRTKHLPTCKKPVFLDFGHCIVEVEHFTETFSKFDGYGRRRDRRWFMQQFLSEVLTANPDDRVVTSEDVGANPWENKPPYFTTKHATRWFNASGNVVTVPERTPCIPLNYDWDHPEKGRRPVWSDLLDHHPELGNGWTKPDLNMIREFLNGETVIVRGALCVMPIKAEFIGRELTVSAAKALLEKVEAHARAGRVPILPEATKQQVIARAQEYERSKYGRLIAQPSQQPGSPSLFD